MDRATRTHLDNLRSEDRQLQNKAFTSIQRATEKPVDWAYEVWDDLVKDLKHKDNHVRAIAAQVLANLVKSDPQNRMLRDFEALLRVTKDEKFVTARHTMKSIWKVGAAGPEQRRMLLTGLERRFKECIAEKNCTLIRYDILVALKNLFDQVKDEQIREKALALIETEDDLKYRKKDAGVWKASRSK